MNVNTERQDDILIVLVDGRVDSSNALDLERELKSVIDANDQAVILDLEHLSYISSAGLRTIVLTGKSLWARKASFVMCSPSAAIRKVFDLSGINQIIPLCASRDEAFATLNE